MNSYKKATRYFGLPLTCLAVAFALCSQTRATVVTLNPVDVKTAEDNGPQDGVFDEFVPLNLGSVDNNGYTSFSTALEFDISVIPLGAKINSAILSLQVNYVEGTRDIALNGYTGTGAISLADFSSNAPISTLILTPTNTEDIVFEPTNFIQTLVNEGAPFAGFNLREDPANNFNYTVILFTTDGPAAPRLVIDFEPAPDSDGDGVPDIVDECPDTPRGAVVDAEGCSLDQLVPCEGPRNGGIWKNHGQYVSAMVQAVKQFELAHLITHAEAEQKIREAAQSDCGKR